MKLSTQRVPKYHGCVSFSWIFPKHKIPIDFKFYQNRSIFAASFAHIAHPVGSLISAPISDKFGRRKAIMLVSIPIVAAWIMLGFAHSFSVICFGFILIGFGMGSVEAPATLYVGEIR